MVSEAEAGATRAAPPAERRPPLSFHGGWAGVLAPFLLFISGVTWLGLSGAPDERGFWPILLTALLLGLLLATDRRAYSEAVIEGMSQPIVMIMIMAWLLAGVLGVLMRASGFVESLVWLAGLARVSGGAYVAAAFLICCVVSTSTGTSIGTILLCGPLLYPPGGALQADPVMLMGALLAGATFGDNVSPVSDTTIASALTQKADMGGVVRSRLKYALPAGFVALVVYAVWGGAGIQGGAPAELLTPSPRGLPMLLAPALILALLLTGRHLLEGLLLGILAAAGLGLAFGLLAPAEFLYVDAESFSARGLVLDGMERGIGASIFTLLLMGLVATIQASGALFRVVSFARERTRGARGAELWIFGAVSAVVLLVAHSVVAMLTVGDFARETGERFGIGPYRRANLLDVTVCSYPFILPYFIPVILAASTSASGLDAGLPRVSPFLTGIANVYSWMLLVAILVAILSGWGREE